MSNNNLWKLPIPIHWYGYSYYSTVLLFSPLVLIEKEEGSTVVAIQGHGHWEKDTRQKGIIPLVMEYGFGQLQ